MLRYASLPSPPAERSSRPLGRGDASAAIAALGSFRLLCAHRRGPYGVATWNTVVESWLASELDRFAEDAWYVGRPLLVTQNDYGLRLFNGDTGVIIARQDGRKTAVFERQGGFVEISPNRLDAVETLHALTIHKSQGSQVEAVAVLLPDQNSRILTRELLYTAVTGRSGSDDRLWDRSGPPRRTCPPGCPCLRSRTPSLGPGYDGRDRLVSGEGKDGRAPLHSDLTPGLLGSDLHGLEMLDQTRVRLPAVELDLARHTQLVLGRRRVILEQLPRAGAAYDDARMTVSRGEHRRAPGVEVECRRVTTTGERMPDENDIELASLKTVRGVDDDLAQVTPLQLHRDGRALVAMAHADCDARRMKGDGLARVLLVADGGLRVEETLHQSKSRLPSSIAWILG